MAFGLDYVSGPPIADMKAANVEFVCRYTGYFSGYNLNAIGTQQGKCLTPGEAKALIEAGISPVSNWEWYANRAVDGATPQDRFNNGAWDARTADTIHKACGGPADRPIYFSVDVDVAGDATVDYFYGVASVIGLARTGAYGSYRVLNYLFNRNLITWGWQTYAWSYGQWESRAHIQQYQNGVSMSSHSVDFDRSIKSDYGQWGTEGNTIVIAYNTPGVKDYFTETSPGVWLSLKSKTPDGKPIYLHGAILEFYKAFGGNYLCGLTHLGIPLSNEIPLGGTHGAVRQHFEDGVLFYDPAHEFDTRPGEPASASVYLAKLYSGAGQDPLVAQLQTENAALQSELAKAQQSTGIDPAKVEAFKQAIGQAAKDGDAAIQALVSQPIS